MRGAAFLTAVTLGLQPAPVVVLDEVARDLTGDGQAEVLRVVGAGPAGGRRSVTLTIESAGKTIFQSRLREYAGGVFEAEKFQSPLEFETSLAASAPGRVREIADVIERNRPPTDRRDGRAIWQEVKKSPVTIFTFSPGGDTIVALGWSMQAGRFYRLLECC